MNKQYNIMAGGLNELINDLDMLERDLWAVNTQATLHLADVLVREIQNNAMSELPDELSDIKDSNVIENMAYGLVAITRVSNTSENATYAEFGYGMLGSLSPYEDFNLFQPTAALGKGSWEYDVKQRGFKPYWYTARDGDKVRSIGQPAGHTFYNAYRSVRMSVGSLVKQAYSKLKLGGK